MLSEWRVSQDNVRLSAQLPVRTEIRQVREIVRPHDHDFYEVCVVMKGTARHETSSERQTLAAGDLIVVPPGGVHAFYDPCDLEVTNLYYLEDWLLSELRMFWGQDGIVPLFFGHQLLAKWAVKEPSIVRLSADELNTIAQEMDALDQERKRDRPSPLLLRACLVKSLVLMSRAFRRTLGVGLNIQLRPEVWVALNAIETTLLEGGTAFSAAQLASRAGVTVAHFGRIFHDDIGLPPRAYFQRRRIQVAKQLLLRHDRSITEIAHELGFNDGAHLCGQFRLQVGLSPREYRNRFSAKLDEKAGRVG
jgi:AraC-like DNA-binding protein